MQKLFDLAFLSLKLYYFLKILDLFPLAFCCWDGRRDININNRLYELCFLIVILFVKILKPAM